MLKRETEIKREIEKVCVCVCVRERELEEQEKRGVEWEVKV
jgi:hypothetical protein